MDKRYKDIFPHQSSREDREISLTLIRLAEMIKSDIIKNGGEDRGAQTIGYSWDGCTLVFLLSHTTCPV